MSLSEYAIHVIQEGYCHDNPDGTFSADCSITLIKGKNNILVDTGGPHDRQLVLDGLEKHGLTPEKITHVIGTHGHLDHIGNLNLFPTATCIVSHDIFNGTVFISHDFKHKAFVIDEGVEVVSTPGHTGSDISVIIKGTPPGTTAIVGDLFECEEDLTDESKWRDVSENPEVQEQNRKKMLGIADFIIPGHGKGFMVLKKT